jgi:predicted TIM-barrel fold metal-dependent hydrolase
MARKLLILVAALFSAGVFGADSPTYDIADFATVEKVDAHVHLHGTLPAFMARAQADGFRLLTINVNYADFPPLDKQLADALALRRTYPRQVAFATTFDASDSNRGEWLARTQRHLETTLRQGAVGVKVWKDIGMQQRDPDGHVVMIDDARFEPIFDTLEKRGIVVLGHLGEPRNAWLPYDAMTTRGDREYFTAHPQYHMFAHPEWPSYEEQLAARDRLLERHPKLQFVALHLASLEWSVERLSGFLRLHPQASVDLAARLVHLKLQASTDPQKVRRFFIEHQDRILYATDLTRSLEQDDAAFAAEAHAVWLDDWRFLASGQPMHSSEFAAPLRGLALPREVVDKIYCGNARRTFPTAWVRAPGETRTRGK